MTSPYVHYYYYYYILYILKSVWPLRTIKDISFRFLYELVIGEMPSFIPLKAVSLPNILG